jgi:hypothetical protein
MFRFLSGILGRSQRENVRSVNANLTLVALVLDELDRALLSNLAAEHGWTIHFGRTREETWELVNSTKAQIVLCERPGVGMDWRDVIRNMVSAPHLVCAILISKAMDNYLWNEVTMWGGHDVLAAPLREEDVLRAIRLAWLYWNSASRNEALSHSV